MAMKSGILRRYFSTNSTLFDQSIVAIASVSAASRVTEQDPPSTTLFVSGLSRRTTNQKLREAFTKFGDVIHVRVITDHNSLTKDCKGFGFVRYANLEDAEKGMKGMDGQLLDGRVIFAEYARPKGQSATSGND